MYMNNRLVYEGEFKNGKRNGKGKSFLRGKLMFEGDIIDDELTKGKYYDEEGNIIKEGDDGNGLRTYFDIDILKFEGEYLNGKRHGKGKEYDETSLKLKFEAEYLKGKRTGKGKEYYVDYRDEVYLIFEGEYVDGLKYIKIRR